MADHKVCCFFSFLTMLMHLSSLSLIRLTEGVTQNFTVSGLDSLSPADSTGLIYLKRYEDMEAYVVYMPESLASQAQQSAACLVFINPALRPSSDSSSFILASLVFGAGADATMGAIVWMANRHHPVSRNFFLTLDQSSGNLILLDGDGSIAWSSNLTSPPNTTVSMALTTTSTYPAGPIGALILSDSANATLWRSSDHPTHALVPYQVLQPGRSLVSWASACDPSDGLYRLVMEAGGLALYYHRYPASPMPYWFFSMYSFSNDDSFSITHTCKYLTHAFVDSKDGSLVLNRSADIAPEGLASSDLCAYSDGSDFLVLSDYYGLDLNLIILSLEYDGNLIAYSVGSAGSSIFDLLGDHKCFLPNICGPYGICSAPSNCECPFTSDGSFPSTFPSDHAQGCPPTRNLTCLQHTDSNTTVAARHQLLRFEGVNYFLNNFSASLYLTSEEACRNVCLQYCPCLMAFWHEHSKSCYHIKDFVGSLQGSLNSSYIAFLKVEAPILKVEAPLSKPLNSNQSRPVIGTVYGVVAMLILVTSVAAILICYKQVYESHDADEDMALRTHLPGLPRRFTYKDL